MLPPIAGDRAGRPGDGVRRHRPAEHDHVVRPAGRGRLRAPARRPTRRPPVTPTAPRRPRRAARAGRAARLVLGRARPTGQRADHDAEHQVAVDDDLLDVEHLDRRRAVVGERGEQPGGDAGPVEPGRSDSRGRRAGRRGGRSSGTGSCDRDPHCAADADGHGLDSR